MKKIHLLLFVLFLGLSAFYDGSCGRTYSFGWPRPILYYNYPHLDEKSHLNFFDEAWLFADQLPLTLAFNLVALGFVFYLLYRFFKSSYYLKRKDQFALSNQLTFFYSVYFTLAGWTFILLNPPTTLPIIGLIHAAYLFPVLYTGGLLILFINSYTIKAAPFSLMPMAYVLSLAFIYFAIYMIRIIIGRLLRRRISIIIPYIIMYGIIFSPTKLICTYNYL